MRPRNQTLMVLFAVLFLATLSQPAAAAFSWYDWTDGYQLVRSGTNPALTSGQDIRNAFYAVNDGYKYFRMELYGSPNLDANGYANQYGFFVNSGTGKDFPQYSVPLGGTGKVDSYLNATVSPTFSGNLLFTPYGETYKNGVAPAVAFDLRFDRNGKYLDWAIPKDQLPDNFTWLAATFHSSTLTVLDKTAAVATPIPSAALLLGTGIVGLIGLRRRSFRKA
jgi:hypothetical protein